MRTSVAILLSTDTFESFFEEQLELTRDEYVNEWRGGWVWSYCRMLKEQGIEPIVYIASLKHRGRHETPDGYAVRFLPLRPYYQPWRSFRALKRSPPARYLAESVNAFALRHELDDSLREDRVDVLFIQEYWTGRYDVLSGLVSVPLVGLDQGHVGRRELKLAKRRALPRASRIITQTDEEASNLSRFGAVATRIPNAVDVDRFTPATNGRHADQHVVLTVAGLRDRHKRLSDLIRALPLLPESWRLELVGTGPDRRMLGELAEELGVAPRVEFAGFVPDKDALCRRLQRCDVFALPSAWEGLPLALLEAMSCGAAVVGSDIPAIAEVIDNGVNGLLVPVGRPQELAEQILEASSRRDELGGRARQTVECDYSERAIGARLGELVMAIKRPHHAHLNQCV